MNLSMFDAPLVLASKSPRRAELLRQAGVAFDCVEAEVQELMDGPAEQLPELNAILKAREVAGRYPDRLVLGADTLIVFEGRALGKPVNREAAVAMLVELSGCVHKVISGYCLAWEGGEHLEHGCCVTEVSFGVFDEKIAQEYVDRVYVLDKAGSYALQNPATVMLKIVVNGSEDNVIGLPVEVVLQKIAKIAEKC